MGGKAVLLRTEVVGVTNVSELRFIHLHACARVSSGEVECWGGNEYGQFGDGTNEDSVTPVLMTGITNATVVAAGYWYTCVLLSSGSIDCAGDNMSGQLGNGTLEGSLTPSAGESGSNKRDLQRV